MIDMQVESERLIVSLGFENFLTPVMSAGSR